MVYYKSKANNMNEKIKGSKPNTDVIKSNRNCDGKAKVIDFVRGT